MFNSLLSNMSKSTVDPLFTYDFCTDLKADRGHLKMAITIPGPKPVPNTANIQPIKLNKQMNCGHHLNKKKASSNYNVKIKAHRNLCRKKYFKKERKKARFKAEDV